MNDATARQERENLERLDALLDRLDAAIETVSKGLGALKRWAEPPRPKAEPYEHPKDCPHPDCQLPF